MEPRAERVVVVGSGFGGLAVARSLRRSGLQVLVLDRTNYHLFQPLLYQVATAGLEPADIAYAARGIVRPWPGVRFRQGELHDVDWERRRLRTTGGEEIGYDHLVLAAGAASATFNVPGVAEHAFTLKSLEDATGLRSHLLEQFERCDADPDLISDGLLTVVVVGGGPTGVEMTGALSELFSRVLTRDYPSMEIHRARIVLVEMTDSVLGAFHPRLRAHAARQLRSRGIELRLSTSVAAVAPDAVRLTDDSVIRSRTVLWAAGVRAAALADRLDLPQTDGGRIVVAPDLSVPGHPGVWAIGDVAATPGRDGHLQPQLAPVAIQGGRHVAEQILRTRAGRTTRPFRYIDKGTMATIGRRAAVTQLPGGLRFQGTLAWLLWLGLHLVTLIGFRNRLSVLLSWAWNYFTWDRHARLILRGPRRPAADPPADRRSSSTPGDVPHQRSTGCVSVQPDH